MIVVKRLLSNSRVQLLLIALLSLTIIFLRQPNAFFHPQFWAEDGSYFYKPAYDNFWGSLLQPYAGSLQTLERIGGLLAQGFPVLWGPSIFLVLALLVQILPVLIIHSRRFRPLLPNAWFRWLVTAFYLMQPNTWEIHANLTNANWHIAVSAALLLIGPAPVSRLGKWLDRLVITIASLTGPFGFLLLPVAAIQSYFARTRNTIEKLLIIAAACAIQFIPLLNAPRAGTVSISAFIHHTGILAKVIGTQVSGVAVLGSNTIGNRPLESTAAILLLIWLTVSTVLAFISGNRQLRLFICFGVLTLLASLFRSQTGNLVVLWQNFLWGQGDRYFFIPTIVWFTALIYLFHVRSILLKSLVAATVFATLFIAIPADFRMPSKQSTGFSSFARQLNSSKKGTVRCNELNPHTPDKAWLLCLTKR